MLFAAIRCNGANLQAPYTSKIENNTGNNATVTTTGVIVEGEEIKEKIQKEIPGPGSKTVPHIKITKYAIEIPGRNISQTRCIPQQHQEKNHKIVLMSTTDAVIVKYQASHGGYVIINAFCN